MPRSRPPGQAKPDRDSRSWQTRFAPSHDDAPRPPDTSALIEDAIERSSHGQHKLGEVTLAITAIMKEAETLKALMSAMGRNNVQQSDQLEQISKALLETRQVTQIIATNAKQSASAGLDLNDQSTTLRAIVDQLTVFVDGKLAGQSHRASAFR